MSHVLNQHHLGRDVRVLAAPLDRRAPRIAARLPQRVSPGARRDMRLAPDCEEQRRAYSGWIALYIQAFCASEVGDDAGLVADVGGDRVGADKARVEAVPLEDGEHACGTDPSRLAGQHLEAEHVRVRTLRVTINVARAACQQPRLRVTIAARRALVPLREYVCHALRRLLSVPPVELLRMQPRGRGVRKVHLSLARPISK
eukprot:scaffold63729_cov36-Phaeocystis_antarctica.AAC.2